MSGDLLVLEGTWEEIATHASELKGRKVRLIVLPLETDSSEDVPAAYRLSTGRSLLRFAGTWVGDDLEKCLQDVYANRTKARF